MDTSSCRVLLVESREADFLALGGLLARVPAPRFELTRVSSIQSAREALKRSHFSVCLLSEDQTIGAIARGALVRDFGRGETAFILLAGSEDYDLDVAAAREGFADYLVKSHLGAPLLERSIRYAMERKSTEAALRAAQDLAQATMDALPESIAVLDDTGCIVMLNAVWRATVGAGFLGAGSEIGTNLLALCRVSQLPVGQAYHAGIEAVLQGETDEICLEYRGHFSRDHLSDQDADEPVASETVDGETITGEPQWYKTCARRFPGGGPLRVVISHADISGRKIAEEKLRQSEANLARAQQIARLGSWELDLIQTEDVNCNPLRWSDEVFRIFGCEPGEIEVSSANFFAAVHPEDRERIADALTRAVEQGSTYSVDHRIVRRDGSERIVHEQGALVRDEHTGAPLKMVGTVQDITEQKLAEGALLGRQEFQRTLLENFPNGSVNVYDAQMRYVLAAGRGLEEAGLDADSLIGRTLSELYTPEQVALVMPFYEQVLAGQTVQFELPLGERFYSICAAPLLNEGNEVSNIIAVAQDSTERRRAERQLHFQNALMEAQMETSLDGILVVSDQRRVLSYNKRLLEMWGIAPHTGPIEDSVLLQAVCARVDNPDEFRERVDYLYGHPHEHSHDEIDLRDGRIFTRYSAPILGADGTNYGRVWYFHDITGRKAATAAAERLASIVESSSDAILSKTLHGIITSWNAGAEMLYGYTAGEAIGRSIWMLTAPGRPDDESELLAQIARGGRVTNYETVRVCKDGRHLDVSLTLSPLKNGAGEVIGVSAISRDISDRKRAETALRASEERFQSIVSSVPGMVYQFVTHPDGTIEWPFVSEGCRDIFEMEPQDLQSAPEMTLGLIHPDDRASFEASVAASAQELVPWNWEGRHLLDSGRSRWIQGTSRPRRLPGGGTLWNGLVMDVSARKQVEIERDRFFTISPDMLCTAGLDGYFKRLNPVFPKTLGFSEAELMALPFVDFVHPDDRTPTTGTVAMLSEGHSVSSFENRYRCKDGSYRWLEWKSVAETEEGLIYAAARDVTERKATEAALLQARDELEERVQGRTAELERSNATLQAEILERERAEREVRAQAKQHEAIADLGRRALLDIDLDTLFQGVVSLVSATLDVTLCSFWERVPGGDTLRWRAGSGIQASEQEPKEYLKSIGDNSHIGHAALLNEPVVSHDLANETRFRLTPFLESKGIASTIAVPVQDGVLYGVLSACSTDQNKFGQNETFFLQTIANVLSSAVARAQTEAEIHGLNLDLQSANAELLVNEARLLQGNRISTDLMRLRVQSHDELQMALREVTEAASLMLDVERASVWLYDESPQRDGDGLPLLYCQDLYQRNAGHHSGRFEIIEDQSLFRAVKSEGIVVIDDVAANPSLSAFWKGYFARLGVSSVLEVALVVGGQHIGVLCLSHVGPPRGWQAEDRTFASAVASVCSLVLESYQRSRAEAALHQAKEEAERARAQAESATLEAQAADAAKSEFLSRMSHELRTPLNAILGFGQLLEMREWEPKQASNIAQILKAGRHLLELINEVLDIARIEAGHMSLSLEPICAGTVVAETLDLVRPLAGARGIELVNQVVGESADLHFLADQQRLKQVLLNLLSNAVKYNCEGGTVFVSVRVVEAAPRALAPVGNLVEEALCDASGAHLRIEVRDTGTGLSPGDIAKLFVPFERLGAAHTQIEGTGIGLTLCKRLVEAMNGHIGVCSRWDEARLDGGSTFWVEMPLARSPLENASQAADVLELLPPAAEVPRTILYIEDNLSNIALIQQVLSEPLHQPKLLTAMQGGVGLELARQHRPDLILLDVHLPDIMGDVVLERLKADAVTREIPVVVLSADATPSQIERLMAGGAHAYLTKPLDLKHFFQVLEDVLGQMPSRQMPSGQGTPVT